MKFQISETCKPKETRKQWLNETETFWRNEVVLAWLVMNLPNLSWNSHVHYLFIRTLHWILSWTRPTHSPRITLLLLRSDLLLPVLNIVPLMCQSPRQSFLFRVFKLFFSQISHFCHTYKLLSHHMFLHSDFSAPFLLLCAAVDLYPSDQWVDQFNP
jgi:hypothetical protein